jgi:hypothetical protein
MQFHVAQSLSQQRKNFDFTFGANIAKAKQLKPNPAKPELKIED